MTIFFNSEILSDILLNPVLNINSFDDLFQFISSHPRVSLISDNDTIAWKHMKTWQSEHVEKLFQIIKSIPVNDFNYEQVYRGESIIIWFDDIFEIIGESNPFLKFHISNDRHFGSQYGLIYSKRLNTKLKSIVNSKIRSLVQTGLQIQLSNKRYSKKLNITDFAILHRSISMDYFKHVIILFQCVNASLFIKLLTEIFCYNNQIK